MPIYAGFWELRVGNSASDGLTGRNRTRHRVFMVKLGSIPTQGEGADWALQHFQIPAKASRFSPLEPGLVVSHRIAELDNPRTKTLYRVTVIYSVDTTAGGSIGAGLAPWLRPSIPSYTTKDYERVLERDYAGPPVAVLNFAGDPPDPPIMTRVVNAVASIHMPRKLTDLNYEAVIVPLVNTVNSASVNINGVAHDKGRCKLLEAPARPMTWTDDAGNETQYWDLHLNIEICKDTAGFNAQKRLSTGYRAFKTASTPSTIGAITVPAYGIDGTQQGYTTVSHPWVLNSNGTALAPGTTPTDSNYQTFKEFPEADWTALKLV